MDRRRRQYVPISVTVAHSKTGKQLKAKFGRDGVLVWILYLLACKTSWVQGQFSYSSEADGWSQLGLYGDEPAFTLEAFFNATGSLKQTSRRRSGDVTDVISSNWEVWNDDIRRQNDAEQKSRKRAGNTATVARRNGDVTTTMRGTEVEVEVEYEEEVEAVAATEPANAALTAPPTSIARGGLSARELRPDACPDCEIVAGHTADCPTQQTGQTPDRIEILIRKGIIGTRVELDEELVGADLEPGDIDRLYELLDATAGGG